MLLGLKLLASGAFEVVLKGLSAAFRWAFEDWRNAPLLVFGMALAFLSFVAVPKIEAERDANLAGWIAEREVHAATVDHYRRAARAARRAAEANAARVKAEQAAITEETIDDYEDRLAAVRARAERLRTRRAAPANSGGVRAADLPDPGAAPRGTAEAPGNPRLPARSADGPRACPPGYACLTLEQALAASEDAIRHDALIDWVIRQSRLRFTPAPIEGVGDDE